MLHFVFTQAWSERNDWYDLQTRRYAIHIGGCSAQYHCKPTSYSVTYDIAQLIECLLGKVVVFQGCEGDATPFTDVTLTAETFEKPKFHNCRCCCVIIIVVAEMMKRVNEDKDDIPSFSNPIQGVA